MYHSFRIDYLQPCCNIWQSEGRIHWRFAHSARYTNIFNPVLPSEVTNGRPLYIRTQQLSRNDCWRLARIVAFRHSLLLGFPAILAVCSWVPRVVFWSREETLVSKYVESRLGSRSLFKHASNGRWSDHCQVIWFPDSLLQLSRQNHPTFVTRTSNKI